MKTMIAAFALCITLPLRAGFKVPCDSTALAGAPLVRGTNCRIVTAGDVPREYIVYVPKSAQFQFSVPSPVVFHYHGSGGSASGTFQENGWPRKAEESGFVAVMGSALPYFEHDTRSFKTKWNNFNLDDSADLSMRPPGYPANAAFPADDVAFTDAMLGDVKSSIAADPRRLYISGFSSGGGMVLRLAVERSRTFAAAGTAGAGLLREVHDTVRNMPIYYAIGNKDRHLVDSVNHAPDAPQPPVNAVPLRYDELFAFPAVQVRFDNLAATFGVSNVPTEIVESAKELRINYQTPLGGNNDHNELIVSIQGKVTHEYPNGGDNPNAFDDTSIFWDYFQTKTLAASVDPRRIVRH